VVWAFRTSGAGILKAAENAARALIDAGGPFTTKPE
jgi:hypothetical protein